MPQTFINWKMAYRGYNALVAAAVLYQYANDPRALATEYLPDVLIHTFEALAPDSLNEVAIVSNLARAFQAGYSFWSGNSSIPTVANIVDVYNHAWNLKHRFSNYFYQPTVAETNPEPHAQPSVVLS